MPVPSFEFPVDPPSTGPFDEPVFQVCINQDWLPFIAGALKQLLLQSTWNAANDTQVLDIQGRVFNLISAFGQVVPGCAEPTPSKLCLSGTFGDLQYGYSDFGGGICAATYVAGTGWQSCYDAPSQQDILYLQRNFAPTQIDSYEFDFHYSGVPRVGLASVTWKLGGVTQRVDSSTTVLGTTITPQSTTPVTADRLEIVTSFGTNSVSVPYVLDDFKMCYTGVFPLSSDPTWVKVYDFTVSDGGWVSDGFNGTYVLGSGWEDTLYYDSGGNVTYQAIGIHKDYSPDVSIYAIEAVYTATDGTNTGPTEGRYVYMWHHDSSIPNRFFQYLTASVPTGVSWTGGITNIDTLGFVATVGYDTGNDNPGGHVVLSRLTLHGVGTPPP